ncbi:MAG TPA: serine/threonine-protein kinase [Candidatus Acidoferrum sp.]|nr:serine/threonine-protein kinase [Candidatus Acidoferrum sp.]
MDTRHICQNCQRPLAPDTPMGLCPQCLIKAGFRSGLETGTATDRRPGFVPLPIEALAKVFPQLEILGLIGQGGMGAVYKARQKQLHRVVALKILPPGIGAERGFAERFTREAQALAQLNHPGIVTLYEYGQVQGDALSKLDSQAAAPNPPPPLCFFLMEYVDGVNLGETLAHGRIPPPEAMSLVAQICDALQFAHDQGIVHRDIKPENILLDRRGRVKVADFGLAMLRGGETEPAVGGGSPLSALALTEAGKVVGTPRYMSPEQLERPGRVDHRADIYALGVVFYQMLTGELPGRSIEPPSQKVPLDVRLDEVVLRALERAPERRFQHASDLKTRVELIAGAQSSSAQAGQPPLASGPLRRASRRLQLAAALIILAVVAGILLAPALRDRRPPPTLADPLGVAIQTIRNEIGRQLREAGATYDELQVTLAGQRPNGQPFQVSYRGLRHFKGTDGSTPRPDGTFRMDYIGAGQWQGALAGTRFTVSVASKENINVPFVNDPAVLGEWKSVDFVADPADFDPSKPPTAGELPFPGITFLPEGKTPQPWLTWTRGLLIHHGDQTASHYEIRQVKGRACLFLEWKSGDFTISGKKPHYYVLQQNSTTIQRSNQ